MRRPNIDELRETVDGIAGRLEQIESQMVDTGDTKWLPAIRFIHWDIVTLAVQLGTPAVEEPVSEAPKRRGGRPRKVTVEAQESEVTQ